MKSLLSTEGDQRIINQILSVLVHTEENGKMSFSLHKRDR